MTDLPQATPPPRTATIVGFVIAGVVLLLWGLGGRGGAAPPPGRVAAPRIVLLAPAAGDTVDAPLRLRFRVESAGLALGPAGWGSGELHIHAHVDDVEIMPGPADIERLDGNDFLWTFPHVAAGPRRIRLAWSDAAHRPVAAGATESIRVHVR
jgi:hypothetical protein